MKNKVDEGPPKIFLAPVPKQSCFYNKLVGTVTTSSCSLVLSVKKLIKRKQ